MTNRPNPIARPDQGASVPDQALVASDQAASRLAPTGFDPSREELIHRVIMAISTASVPHESPLVGALETRSLGYYLGVGIDHFGHDFDRHETLLRKAAEQAIAAIRQSKRTGG
jgi:hypothetical protein